MTTDPQPMLRRGWLAWLPIPALLLLMAVLKFSAPPTAFYDPSWLILIGNTLFVGGVGFAVAAIAWRNYLATGRMQVLLLGCAMLLFGLGGVLAAVVRGLPGGANLNVTIYNTGALLGAGLHFLAALMLLTGAASATGAGRRARWLGCAYGGSILFMAGVTAASFAGALPPFFVQGVGPTPVRQEVLGAAIILFAFSFLVFMGRYVRNREPFLYWYAGGLALTAISLTGFFIQHSVGSPVGWVGRCAQYLGGTYFLVSLATARRSARRRHGSLDDVLAAALTVEEALRASEARYRNLFDNMTEEVHYWQLVRDAQGRIQTWRLLDANPPALKTWGRQSVDEVRGKTTDEIFGPGATEHYMPAVQKIMTERVPHSFEDYFPQLDRHFRFTSVPLGECFITTGADITSIKKSELAVQQSRKTLSELVERSPFGTYVVDSTFRIAMMNAASQTGAFRNVRPVIGRDFSEAMRTLWPEPVAADIIGHFRRTLETGEPYYSRDFINPRHDAEIVEAYEWELHRMTLPDAEHGVICYFYDSTKLRETEAAARASERRLVAVLESMPDAFVSFDADLRYTYVNGRAEQLQAARREELLGKDVRTVYPDPESYKSISQYERVLREKTPRSFAFFHAGFGRWVEVKAFPTPDGVAVFFRDISAKITADEALRNSRAAALNLMRDAVAARQEAEQASAAVQEGERRERERAEELTVLFEAVPVPVFIARDPECLHITGNRLADEILRIPHGKELSMSAPDDTRPVHFRPIKDGRELRLEELPAQRSARGERVRDFEFSIVFDDGLTRHLLGYGTPLLDDQGRPRGTVAALVDITERKRAEAEIQRQVDNLRVANDELARFNRAMVDRELRMLELKKQVNELCRQAGLPPRYKVEFERGKVRGEQ